MVSANKNIFKQNKTQLIMQKKKSGVFPADKKGQEMSVTTIILIVLGLAVLVILILGFRIGWSKILPFLPSNNVQNVVASCNAACATGNEYEFCTVSRALKADGLPGGVKEVKNNCDFFATDTQYSAYGIEKCSSITCEDTSGAGAATTPPVSPTP